MVVAKPPLVAAKAMKEFEAEAERRRKEHMHELKKIARGSKTRCNCAKAHPLRKPKCKTRAFAKSSCIQVENWAPAYRPRGFTKVRLKILITIVITFANVAHKQCPFGEISLTNGSATRKKH